jgi:hypothetical protein
MRYKCVLRLLLLLCATTLTSAQSTNASISGRVIDPSGRILPDADIQILNEATGVQYSNATNRFGIYTVPILPPGQYRVQVSRNGFKTIIKSGIVLNVQSAMELNFMLPLGAASESITVEAGSSLINTTDASVGTVVDQQFVSNIPLNGRSFQDLISLTPGVVTQSPQAPNQGVGYAGDFSVNGQRTESNYYTVDGVSQNSGAGSGSGNAQSAVGGTIGTSTVLGTTQSLIPVDALREFRVQSSSYSAEFGRSPGGQFSLATRSGTNDLHGSMFDYLRNNFFDANDWFNDEYGKPTPALRQNDFGGTFGGPIWLPRLFKGTNRTFFFGAYEGLRLTQPTAATIQYVPDTYMRQQAVPAMRPILNAFPVQNGIDYGTAESPSLAQFIEPYSAPAQIDAFNLRIDEIASTKLAIFFRFGTTSSSSFSRPQFLLEKNKGSVQSYTFGATAQISNRWSNELRVGYVQSDATQVFQLDGFGGATPINLNQALGLGDFARPTPLLYFSFPGVGYTIMEGGSSQNLSRQLNIVDTFEASLGRHQIRFGIDYRHIRSPLRPSDLLGEAEFASAGSILTGTPSVANALAYRAATPLFGETSAFLQDNWKVNSHLNVALGLRWEVDPPPTEANGNNAYTLLGSVDAPQSLKLAPEGSPLYKTSWYNIAPRLGLAWTVRSDLGHETVLRAGGGAFFDSPNEIAALGYSGFGFSADKTLTGALLPFTPSELAVPFSTEPPYTSNAIYAFPSHLQLPYTLQWNLSAQQSLGKSQAVTVSYVGSNGRRLLSRQYLSLAALNPTFGYVYYFPGGITSDYQALQVQFQRSVFHGISALASYTWGHSIDFGSTALAFQATRGSSDFDVRNNLQGGLAWELPAVHGKRVLSSLFDNWGVDGRLNVRSAFPIPLQGSLITDSLGNNYYGGLNLVQGTSLYVYGPKYAGGRAVNRAAFTLPVTASEGNAPRNLARGFGANQFNLAFRRGFQIHDQVILQFRGEAFNVFNHPNFGYIDPTYTDATFGQATQMLNSSLATMSSQYQQGGPRSMQFSLRLSF